jgi:transposase InsO family protein
MLSAAWTHSSMTIPSLAVASAAPPESSSTRFVTRRSHGSRKKRTGVFSIIDQYSKYLFSTPLTSESLDENIRCLELWLAKLKELGVDKQVRIVRSDNGSGFQDRFTEWLAEHT